MFLERFVMQTGNGIANNQTLNFSVELLLIIIIVVLAIAIIFLSVVIYQKYKENKRLKELTDNQFTEKERSLISYYRKLDNNDKTIIENEIETRNKNDGD